MADQLFPARSVALDACLVLGGVALTALLAQVVIPLPFTPVPITGQTFAVLVVGTSLGLRRGLLAQALYVLIGLLGAPIFAAGSAGVGALFSASGGYLIGFIAAATLLGYLAELGWDRGRRALIAMIAGELVIYAFGASWLSFYVGFPQSIILGVLPFVIGDGIKLLAAAGLMPTVWRLTRRAL